MSFIRQFQLFFKPYPSIIFLYNYKLAPLRPLAELSTERNWRVTRQNFAEMMAWLVLTGQFDDR